MERIDQIIWGWPMLILFLGVGLFFTVRLRFLQVRRLGDAFRFAFSKDACGGISPYGALCTALAATIGTGNIVGVATALAVGGPGALLWMLISAFFGMATQYCECFLAAKYRKSAGFGGPFAYIELALGKKWLAKLYALLGAGAGLLGVGTVTQVTSITTAVDAFFPSEPFAFGQSLTVVLTGLIVLAFSAAVLLGGAKRISRVCESLVPFMSAIYIFGCITLLLCTAEQIPAAISLIFRSAFSPEAALGAASGIGLKAAVRMGISRGVFTNEAGLGTCAIAAASTDVNNPVRQGLSSMVGTFIDTIIICTMTGLCLVTTGAWSFPSEAVGLTDLAWQTGLPFAPRFSSFLLMLCLVFFAFATIIGWNFYAERCLQYLTTRGQRLYRFFYLCAIAIAPYYSAQLAWQSADIMNALLAVPNLIALICLQNTIVRESRKNMRSPLKFVELSAKMK